MILAFLVLYLVCVYATLIGVAWPRYDDGWPTPLDRGLLHTPPDALPPVVLKLQRHASVHSLQEQKQQQLAAAASTDSESKNDADLSSSTQGRTTPAMLGTNSSGRSSSQVRVFFFFFGEL